MRNLTLGDMECDYLWAKAIFYLETHSFATQVLRCGVRCNLAVCRVWLFVAQRVVLSERLRSSRGEIKCKSQHQRNTEMHLSIN